MSRPVAYGQVSGSEYAWAYPVAASQSFNALGGKFVCMVASYLYLAGTGSKSDIIGWAQAGTFVAQSTNGRDSVAVIIDPSAVFEMPVSSSLSETDCKARLGLTCDWVIQSGIQYASPTTSTYDQLRIVGYKYYGPGTGEQSLLVKLFNTAVETITGVV